MGLYLWRQLARQILANNFRGHRPIANQIEVSTASPAVYSVSVTPAVYSPFFGKWLPVSQLHARAGAMLIALPRMARHAGERTDRLKVQAGGQPQYVVAGGRFGPATSVDVV